MGEKSKNKESPKKKTKKSARSPGVETPKSKSLRLLLVPEQSSNKLPYDLIGPEIYGIQDSFAQKLKSNKARAFKVGNEIKGKKKTYVVSEVLGAQTYVVKPVDSNESLIMRVEPYFMQLGGPVLRRELLFVLCAKKRSMNIHRTHFMTFSDVAETPPTCSAVFMNKTDYSLADIRQKQMHGAEFSPQTAGRLCLETLQAVHDVHRTLFVHRDIQPKNFRIGGTRSGGRKSKIFITGFGYSYDLKLLDGKVGLPAAKELAKLPEMNGIFQSRNYHRYTNTTDQLCDLESWVYLCYYFFNSKALPWARVEKLSEREYLNHKEAFFSGAYDATFEKLGLPPQLTGIRNHFLRIGPNDLIDYPSFAHILMLIGADVKVSWPAPYEWEKLWKPSKKTVDETEENTDVPVSAYLFTKAVDELVHREQKSPISPIGRGQALHYYGNAEQTQDQTVDSPVDKKVVKKPAAAKAPKKTVKPIEKPEPTQEDNSDEIESTTVDESTSVAKTPVKRDVAGGKLKKGKSQKASQDEKSESN